MKDQPKPSRRWRLAWLKCRLAWMQLADPGYQRGVRLTGVSHHVGISLGDPKFRSSTRTVQAQSGKPYFSDPRIIPGCRRFFLSTTHRLLSEKIEND